MFYSLVIIFCIELLLIRELASEQTQHINGPMLMKFTDITLFPITLKHLAWWNGILETQLQLEFHWQHFSGYSDVLHVIEYDLNLCQPAFMSLKIKGWKWKWLPLNIISNNPLVKILLPFLVPLGSVDIKALEPTGERLPPRYTPTVTLKRKLILSPGHFEFLMPVNHHTKKNEGTL